MIKIEFNFDDPDIVFPPGNPSPIVIRKEFLLGRKIMINYRIIQPFQSFMDYTPHVRFNCVSKKGDNSINIPQFVLKRAILVSADAAM
jgi:hypothetical protein